jgi:hypothetical protein
LPEGAYSSTLVLNHDWSPVYFTFTKVSCLAEVKTSVCEQKNQHTDMTGDGNQEPLNDSPVSYPKTTRSPYIKIMMDMKLFFYQANLRTETAKSAT